VEKLSRLFVIAALVALLASCGVFFAPKKGRWNIQDPGNDLLTFKPSADGYVEGTTWHDGVPELYAWPGSKIILMRFNTKEFPDSVAASYIRLKVNMNPSNDADLFIHRIASTWDISTIQYTVADDPVKFFDDSAEIMVTIPSGIPVGEDVQIPLSEIYSGGKEKLSNGLIIHTTETLKFYSAESGTGPILFVEPG